MLERLKYNELLYNFERKSWGLTKFIFTILKIKLDFYILAVPSLQYVFQNYKLNRSITVSGFNADFKGFAIKRSNPIQYYVTSFTTSQIFVFNENWNYVLNKTFNSVSISYMISVGNTFYITADSNVWKLDERLNVLIRHSDSTATYAGLCYSSTNRLIYVVPYNLRKIHVYNLFLNLSHTFSISPHYPCSISEYNNRLYVGTDYGTMLVIVNKQINLEFNACKGKNMNIFAIMFDELNNIATSCYVDDLYLYNITGSFLKKNIQIYEMAYYIGFDTKSRFVVVTDTKISLFY
jgi:hypothetical protein